MFLKTTFSKFDDYGLRHLPAHLAAFENWDNLTGLLCDLHFIEAKCAAGMTYDLISDYGAALDAFPEAAEEKREKAEHEKGIAKYVKNLIDFSRGESPALDIIPSVEPWSRVKIEKETQRINNNPTRLDRIRAFSQFVSSESHGLAKSASQGGYCLQQAYNFADSGPVAHMAKPLVRDNAKDLLLSLHPSRRFGYNPSPALVRTIEGKNDAAFNSITCVDVTLDARIAVSGNEDKTLQLWDLRSGECLGILTGHSEDLTSVSITPDGGKAVSASADHSIRLWDIADRRCIGIFNGHTEAVHTVDISPDGNKIVSGSYDKTIKVWAVDEGRCIQTLCGHEKAVSCVRMTTDGKKAVSSSLDKSIRIWNLETGQCLGILEGHEEPVECISIIPTASRIISGAWDNTLLVWDFETRECLQQYKINDLERISAVSITPDGKRAAFGSDNWHLYLLNLETGEHNGGLDGHSGRLNSVKISPDGKMAISAGDDNTIRIWNTESPEFLKSRKEYPVQLVSVDASSDGGRAAAGSLDNTIRIWDFEKGEPLGVLKGHTDEVHSVCFTPDGKRVVSGGRDSTIRTWDVETGECLATFIGIATLPVLCVGVAPDQRHIVSAGGDKNVCIWDMETGGCLNTLEGHNEWVYSVDVSPDGKTVVSGSGRNILKWDENGNHTFSETLGLWDISGGRSLRMMKGHTGPVECVRISPDGRRWVSGSRDETIRVWDAKTGKCTMAVIAHPGGVLDLRIAPDGKRIVSGGEDQMLAVWDIETGERLASCQAKSTVSSVSRIRADGRFAYTTWSGDFIIMTPKNFPMEPPIVTPVRIRRRGKKGAANGYWDDKIRATCPWCGQSFPTPNYILDSIERINRIAGAPPAQSPCLDLPDEAWEEPALLSECLICRMPLKYNPFFVDNK